MSEIPKQKKGKWIEKNMNAALKLLLEKKITQRQAAETFNVPKTTLGDRFRAIQAGKSVNLTPQMGKFKRTFSEELEKQLVLYVKDQDAKFMPFSKKEFCKFAYDLAEHLKLPHQFKKEKKTAGKQFYYDFMARHPDLSLRTPQSTSIQRALGFSRHQVDRFFIKYAELLKKYDFSASKIFNCDETGVSIVHDNSTKVISERGKKQVSKLTTAERGRNVTVLLSINAAGDIFVPPLFVFPNKKRIDEVLKKDSPPGSIFVAEENGWISGKSFLKWIEIFVETTRPNEKKPVLLILDGHASHKNLDVIIFAKNHHVHMLSLPPHTTHKLQPLDRAIMRPFKAAYNNACSAWMRKYQPLKISQKDVAGLVNTAYNSICRMDLAQSAFRCTGLWPLNRAVFTDVDFIPSENFRESKPEPTSRILPLSVEEPESVSPSSILSIEPSEPSLSVTLNNTNLSLNSSTGVLSNFMEIVKLISPRNDTLELKTKRRRQRTQHSEILTSTAFIDELQEKKKLNEEKKINSEKRKAERNKRAGEAEKRKAEKQLRKKNKKRQLNKPEARI